MLSLRGFLGSWFENGAMGERRDGIDIPGSLDGKLVLEGATRRLPIPGPSRAVSAELAVGLGFRSGTCGFESGLVSLWLGRLSVSLVRSLLVFPFPFSLLSILCILAFSNPTNHY